MSVTPDDLLQWADSFPFQGEVEGRAVVGRAYYAAFHRCEDWRSRLKYQSPVGRGNFGDHEWLIQRLKNPSLGLPKSVQALSQDLGDRLHKLKTVRTLADYRLSNRWPTGIEDQACDEAAEILRLAV
jgi:hypothetical protein